MSRRAVSVQDHTRWIFNRLARDYESRPGYPAPLIERLAALGGGPGGRVADMGAGTGHLARPLAQAGLQVWAVEPAAGMLGALEEGARRDGLLVATPPPAPPLTLVHATGEATGLRASSFDLVVLADALHWVDAAQAGREAARLLRPGGVAAVVVPRLASTPFLDALSARLAAANPKARPGEPPVALFLSHAGAAPLPPERFPHEEPLSPERLDAVLRSLSLVGPALGPAGLEALLADARALAAAHGGALWRREIALHAGRTPAPGARRAGGPP